MLPWAPASLASLPLSETGNVVQGWGRCPEFESCWNHVALAGLELPGGLLSGMASWGLLCWTGRKGNELATGICHKRMAGDAKAAGVTIRVPSPIDPRAWPRQERHPWDLGLQHGLGSPPTAWRQDPASYLLHQPLDLALRLLYHQVRPQSPGLQPLQNLIIARERPAFQKCPQVHLRGADRATVLSPGCTRKAEELSSVGTLLWGYFGAGHPRAMTLPFLENKAFKILWGPVLRAAYDSHRLWPDIPPRQLEPWLVS